MGGAIGGLGGVGAVGGLVGTMVGLNFSLAAAACACVCAGKIMGVLLAESPMLLSGLFISAIRNSGIGPKAGHPVGVAGAAVGAALMAMARVSYPFTTHSSLPVCTSIMSPCTGIFGPIIGLWRARSTACITFWRSLAKRPKNSVTLSGSFERSIPRALKRSVNSSIEIWRTRQSEWPMIAISFAPLIAQASAIERMVLLIGPVSTLPAFRSQMNCSSGNPSASGMNRFSRGSMQVSAATGSALEKPSSDSEAGEPLEAALWFASIMASKRRINLRS